MTLDDLLNEAKSNNTPATIDTKTESPVVDNKTFPQDEGQQPRQSGVDLGKRRTRNPSLITDIIGKIRQPENQPYHEQELLMACSDSDSDDNMHDPRSNTQLCNNDSIAQCSQDTYEEQQFAIQHKQEVLNAQQQQQEKTENKRRPLSIDELNNKVSDKFQQMKEKFDALKAGHQRSSPALDVGLKRQRYCL